jgi:hypothetical protein
MSGYFGYSMSNNAVDAYRCGEMPLSKWLKTDLINGIEDVLENKADISKFRKLTVKQLKKYFLFESSWHHTSKMYNETSFYSIDDENIKRFLTGDLVIIDKKTETPKQKEMIVIQYPIWGGTKKHPKIVDYETMIGEVKGDWCVSATGRKKLSGNWIKVIRKYNKTI